MEEVIHRVGQALKAFSEGKTKTPLRHVLPFNKHNRYIVMPALSDELKIVGLKTVSFAPDNPKNGKAIISGSVILSDYETGETLAVLDGGYLTKLRTGAISGLATKYLSRKDAKVLCVIGAGIQAEGLIEAMMAVRDIEVVHFSSRTKEKADQLSKDTQTKFGVEVYVHDQSD